MSSFAQQITAVEQRINGLRDQLTEHWSKTDETNVSDDQLQAATEITDRITQEERTLTALREAERHLGATSEDGNSRDSSGRVLVPARASQSSIVLNPSTSARPFSLPPKKLTAIDHLIRAGTIQLLAHRDRVPFQQKMLEIYGDDECTRAVLEWSIRAATAPAMTTQTGWAAELVQQLVTDFMAVLYPKAVYPRLAALGLSLSFGSNGRIIIPTRATTPTIAGSFVGEGLPIPVRQGLFTSQTLTPKKMAVITTWTREISDHSVPGDRGPAAQRDRRKTPRSRSIRVLLDSQPGDGDSSSRHPQRRGWPDAHRRRRLRRSGRRHQAADRCAAHRHQGQRPQSLLAAKSRNR